MLGEGKWHFIGIGGVGMSGIAKAWLELGNPVSGSDLAASMLTDRLSALGADVYIGPHDPAYITGDLEAVVVSSAIRGDNPELLAAEAKGIPVIKRGTCLARLMEYKKGVAIAGAHGKTTTSSMIALLLERGGLDPAFFIGAYVENLDTNGKWGAGDYMAAEADESDGSFLEMNPEIVVVTNVEDDHLDYYGSTDKIDEAFLAFVNNVPITGKAVLCTDDPGVRRILPGISHDRIIGYGMAEGADVRCGEERYAGGFMTAEVYLHEKPAGVLRLRVFGRHNLLNALGAIAAGAACGLEFDTMLRILREFKGAHRRMEYLGERGGVRIYDDYAHHPTEIEATMEAAGHMGAQRMLVLFQPHRFTRTSLLAQRFSTAFGKADELILLPIYGAGEEPIDGVSVSLIADAVAQDRGAKPLVAETFEEACDILESLLAPGDMILTLGAGDIRRAGEILLSRLNGGLRER